MPGASRAWAAPRSSCELVLTHPFVIGELACGNLRNRKEILALLGELPRAATATDDEVLAFIDRRHSLGSGLGYIDVHLLASAMLSREARLWTRDQHLAQVTSTLKLVYDETP